jgi:hypothetical protein
MAVPKDFLQNGAGDLDFSQGVRFTPDLKTYVEQALTVNLDVFLAEWFLDLRLGMPLFRDVIGEQFDPALCEAIYRKGAEKTRGVGAVQSLTLDFDSSTRTMRVDLDALTTEGEVLDPGPFVIDLG